MKLINWFGLGAFIIGVVARSDIALASCTTELPL